MFSHKKSQILVLCTNTESVGIKNMEPDSS